MAWFKLNDSLNTLKGQISNVSNVVQEVFTEGIVENEPFSKLEEAEKKIEGLTSLCSTQDTEIASLRRQIMEFHQIKSPDIAGTSKLLADNNAAFEDSWFWEPEQTTTTASSASSKDNEIASSKSGSGCDLTIIPLDSHRNGSEMTEKLRRIIEEKDSKLKKIKIENAILNEKVNQLNADNKEVNSHIEELEKEHGLAVDTLLSMKHDLQYKHDLIKEELDSVKNEKSSLEENNEKFLQLKQSFDKVEKSYLNSVQINQEFQSKIDLLNAELLRKTAENNELLASLDEKDKELTEKFEYVDVEKEKVEQDEIHLLQSELSTLQTKLLDFNELKHEYEIMKTKLNKTQIEEKLTTEENMKIENSSQTDIDEQDLINIEKFQIETTFNTLQEDNLILQREFYHLNENNKILLEDYADQQQNYSDLKEKHEKLRHDYSDCCKIAEKRKTEIAEEFEHFKAIASESESRLVQENVILQKQLIDLQSSLNNKITENCDSNVIDFTELKNIIIKYVKYNGVLEPTKLSFEEFYKFIGESLVNIETIENKLHEITETLHNVSAEKNRIQHEKDTIQADLHHYEVEVAELMKNNEILITEIDHLKTGKLETISEHNEDSVVILEKQLEDCSILNQNLEDEYNDIRKQLVDSESEKNGLLKEINSLKEDLKVKNDNINNIMRKLEITETEKSNLLFEINEFKTDDSKSILQDEIENHKIYSAELQRQLDALNIDHSDLVGKMQLLQKTYLENKNSLQETILQNQTSLEEMHNLIKKKENDIQELLQELDILKRNQDDIDNNKQLLLQNIQQNKMELDTVQTILNKKLDENTKLMEKFKNEQDKYISLTDNNKILNETIEELRMKLSEYSTNENFIVEHKNLLHNFEIVSTEKNELIALITAKHQENVQYHSEIQRLDQLLASEILKSSNCVQCKELTLQLDQFKSNTKEMDKLQDQVIFLREKSDILTQNLLTEQNNQKLLNQEKIELIEEKNNLSKDLDRLRKHLLEIEESHTQETIELQKIIDETKRKMSAIEDDAKKSSTAYTSASIRANQHTETLQAQYMLLTQQRDELSVKLSAAEDKESRNEAALINLQCALEQFQKNKDKDVEYITHRIQKDLKAEKVKYSELLNEMQLLKNQLAESKNGLLAATRISDQLEICQEINSTLKVELRMYQEKYETIEKKLLEMESSHADKVEKGLLKNLVIGYIVAPNISDKSQILKLISAVLDFNQNESDKVGLHKNQVGWLNSILNVGSGSNTTTATNENYNKEGLAQAFVKFLEKESQPRHKSEKMPNLLNIVQHHQPIQQPSPSPIESFGSEFHQSGSAQNSAAVQPILLSDTVLQNFAPPRNSSSILKDILNDS